MAVRAYDVCHDVILTPRNRHTRGYPSFIFTLVEMDPRQPISSGASSSSPSMGVPSGKVSSQMDAVIRLMTGKESRTIAEKLADTNRPTWDQYKKDNEDKLNLSGAEIKKMEEYRKQLDAEREQRLNRGVNHHAGTEDKKKKHGHEKHKRKRDDKVSSSDESSSDDSSSGDGEEESRRLKRSHRSKHEKKRKHSFKEKERKEESSRKKHRKRKSRRDSSTDSSQSSISAHKKSKRRHRRKGSDNYEEGEDNSDGDHYRLSTFFAKDSDHHSSSHR